MFLKHDWPECIGLATPNLGFPVYGDCLRMIHQIETYHMEYMHGNLSTPHLPGLATWSVYMTCTRRGVTLSFPR